VVLVSGRAAQEIPRLVALQHPVEVWGSHGAERLLPHGRYTVAPLSGAARDGFEQAAAWAAAYAIEDRFERKPAAVALHWRDLSARAANSLRDQALEAWQQIARAARLAVHTFDGGLELRAPGFDKGAVVRTLLVEEGDGVAAAFLGDDVTDEDAFAAITGQGLGVLVRDEQRPTRASLWLRPPDELRAFLHHWHRAASRSRATTG
jgi:trehalose-phosphatase